MPDPYSLRLRLKLISEFDQLAVRLDHNEPGAVEEARDRIAGMTLCDEPDILAMFIRAMARTLADMQDEIDRGGWTTKDGE